MKINRIQLKKIRNYKDLLIEFDPGVHLFLGDNAQGKTNLLEALFFAVLGKSFRAGHEDEMVMWGVERGSLCIDFSNKVSDHTLLIHFNKAGTRENFLDGQEIKKKEIVGLVNAVFFSPDDLYLIKGSPSVRRRFIDFEISQVNLSYYQALIQYNKILSQRNYLLKQVYEGKEKKSIIDLWDEQLILVAEKIVLERMEKTKRLSAAAQHIHEKITNGTECFSAHYFVFGFGNQTQWEQKEYIEWYKKRLKEGREKDIFKGTTEYGPHKDDIIFQINSYDGKIFASQGQQRTAVLSLKIAEIELMHQYTGEYPVLLLDDVMSELDEKRRVKIIEEIEGKVQTFITGTERLPDLNRLKTTTYLIHDGCVFQ